MDAIFSGYPLWLIVTATGITLFAGFVKGAVGFAFPMIVLSGLGSFLPAETALAILIIPTVVTNIFQAFRQGFGAALVVVRRYWLFLLIMLVFLVSSAQLVAIISEQVLLIIVGVPMVIFAAMQLGRWSLMLRPETRTRDELLIGGFAGFIGGMSGSWGPPTVLYLTAIGAAKSEAMRAQGVIYGIGAVALLAAHLQSGVLNATTIPLSAAALVPALAGMALGLRVHDRMPQQTFRRAMLVVLMIAGLNLIRRALMG